MYQTNSATFHSDFVRPFSADAALVKWVKEKKMLLNTEKGKTEVTFFAAG